MLRAVGFDVFTERTAWRQWPLGIDVVNFQSFNSYLADAIGSTTFSFAVNLGIYFMYVPYTLGEERIKHEHDRLLPQEYQCMLRRPLHKTLLQPALPRPDVWLIDADGSNLLAVVNDAGEVLISEGLPWFEQYRDPSRLLQVLLECPNAVLDDGTHGFGANPSPIRSHLTNFTVSHLGLPTKPQRP
jgi:hypothetical protein